MKRPAKATVRRGILKNASKGKALKKDPTKNKLNAANLKKLGEAKLKDKILKAAESHEEPEEAAESLKKEMSTVDKSNAWNQHQAYLNKPGNQAEKKEFEKMDKNSKGTATALYLLKKNKAVFGAVSKKATTESSLKKREKWMSEKEVYNKWTHDEINLHLGSGRLVSRECPSTWGVYEYMDTMDLEKETMGKFGTSWTFDQQYEVEDEEDLVNWTKVLEQDLHSLMMGTLEKGKGKGLEKGKAKGRSLEKGKGKGQAGGKSGQLALEDQQPEETPMDLAEALKKSKKLRNLLQCAHSNFEAALKKVQKSPYLSKASKSDKQQMLQQLSKKLQVTKNILEKGQKNKLEAVKVHLTATCSLLKEAKDEAKELIQLGQKADSKASSSKG